MDEVCHNGLYLVVGFVDGFDCLPSGHHVPCNTVYLA